MTAKKLTPKQARFIKEYMIDFNATQAAVRAKYSKRSAEAIGLENLGKPRIAAEIAKLMATREAKIDKRLEAADITAERTVLELARLAFQDPVNLFDEKGDVIPFHELPKDVTATVSSIEFTQDADGKPVPSKIKFWDKNTAAANLGRHQELFTDRVKVEKLGDWSDEELIARHQALTEKRDNVH